MNTNPKTIYCHECGDFFDESECSETLNGKRCCADCWVSFYYQAEDLFDSDDDD